MDEVGVMRVIIIIIDAKTERKVGAKGKKRGIPIYQHNGRKQKERGLKGTFSEGADHLSRLRSWNKDVRRERRKETGCGKEDEAETGR